MFNIKYFYLQNITVKPRISVLGVSKKYFNRNIYRNNRDNHSLLF